MNPKPMKNGEKWTESQLEAVQKKQCGLREAGKKGENGEEGKDNRKKSETNER